MSNILSPKKIYELLSTKVIGQDHAKRVLSTALFMHYTSLRYNEDHGLTGKPMLNNNILIMGPSGNGKTLMINEAIKALRFLTQDEAMPLHIIDTTALSPAGWAGNGLDDHMDVILNKNLTQRERDTMVLYFDEFDKICIPAISSGGTDHNKNTQYSILTAIEGAGVLSSGPGGRSKKDVDTSKWLCVFSGNFAKLRENRDKLKKPGIGFSPQPGKQIDPTDLFQLLTDSGMATQIAGRLGHVVELVELKKNELHQIATELLLPKYIEFFNYHENTLYVGNDVISKCVDKAIERKTGARGLTSLLNEYIKDLAFDLELDLSRNNNAVAYSLDKFSKELIFVQQEDLDEAWVDPEGLDEYLFSDVVYDEEEQTDPIDDLLDESSKLLQNKSDQALDVLFQLNDIHIQLDKLEKTLEDKDDE